MYLRTTSLVMPFSMTRMEVNCLSTNSIPQKVQNSKVVEEKVALFLKNLGLIPIEISKEESEIEDEDGKYARIKQQEL